jgi:hypothetical protein
VIGDGRVFYGVFIPVSTSPTLLGYDIAPASLVLVGWKIREQHNNHLGLCYYIPLCHNPITSLYPTPIQTTPHNTAIMPRQFFVGGNFKMYAAFSPHLPK